MLRIVAVLAALLLSAVSANAATCFWVGGTGNFDNANAASWSSGTGGTASTCAATGGIPKNAGDLATFDGASGGGTVTVCGTAAANCPTSSGLLSIAQITFGAFTGTLDFATRNPDVTLSTAFDGSGSGTRTLNMGNGTWLIQGFNNNTWNYSTVTGLTHNPNSSTLSFIPSSATPTGQINFVSGGKSYNVVTHSGVTNAAVLFISGAPTIATLQLTPPVSVNFANSVTTTITNAFTWTGSSSNQFFIQSDSNNASATIAAAAGSTMQWGGIRRMAFTGNTPVATNSFDLRSNSGVTITPPATGGGGRCIGC